MDSIITLTFSPCIDKTTSIPRLLPEKKLRCSQPTLEPGGGGINVARAIRKLGGSAIAIFPSGGYTGKYFNHLLEREGVPCLIVDSANETRENIIVLEEASGHQYRFGMPGAPLQEKEWMECLLAVENAKDTDFIIASGSLPPGVPMDIYERLGVIARKKGSKLVVDTSGQALVQAVKGGPFLIKPNLGELAELTGVAHIEPAETVELAKRLIIKHGISIIVVSLGEAGAVLVTKDESFKAKAPHSERKSTVGAGDSMLAGLVYSLWKGIGLKQALQYGVACGTAATLNPGTELCRKADADYLYERIAG